ncbi:Protein of unknown function [Pyronema omphalodes CBS 100304]|uniref:Uncharacterized protein n=1 Tax=Pyronema omphalodes (strain CBS 100304) TaxID=1076935 RepID=U4LA83_PYROM|nr:Protein of unknown function [Pyronema omphalodes CBS 100304]
MASQGTMPGSPRSSRLRRPRNCSHDAGNTMFAPNQQIVLNKATNLLDNFNLPSLPTDTNPVYYEYANNVDNAGSRRGSVEQRSTAQNSTEPHSTEQHTYQQLPYQPERDTHTTLLDCRRVASFIQRGIGSSFFQVVEFMDCLDLENFFSETEADDKGNRYPKYGFSLSFPPEIHQFMLSDVSVEASRESATIFVRIPYLSREGSHVQGLSMKLTDYMTTLGTQNTGEDDIWVHQAWFVLVNGRAILAARSPGDSNSSSNARPILAPRQHRQGALHALMHMISNMVQSSEELLLESFTDTTTGYEFQSFIDDWPTKLAQHQSRLVGVRRVLDDQLKVLKRLKDILDQSLTLTTTRLGVDDDSRYERSMIHIPVISDQTIPQISCAIRQINIVLQNRQTIRENIAQLISTVRYLTNLSEMKTLQTKLDTSSTNTSNAITEKIEALQTTVQNSSTTGNNQITEALKSTLDATTTATTEQAKVLKTTLEDSNVVTKEVAKEQMKYAEALNDEIAYQGKSISAFTALNVLFLPLGFFAQFLGLDASGEFGKKQSLFWAITAPFTAAIMGITLHYVIVSQYEPRKVGRFIWGLISEWRADPVLDRASVRAQKRFLNGLPLYKIKLESSRTMASNSTGTLPLELDRTPANGNSNTSPQELGNFAATHSNTQIPGTAHASGSNSQSPANALASTLDPSGPAVISAATASPPVPSSTPVTASNSLGPATTPAAPSNAPGQGSRPAISSNPPGPSSRPATFSNRPATSGNSAAARYTPPVLPSIEYLLPPNENKEINSQPLLFGSLNLPNLPLRSPGVFRFDKSTGYLFLNAIDKHDYMYYAHISPTFPSDGKAERRIVWKKIRLPFEQEPLFFKGKFKQLRDASGVEELWAVLSGGGKTLWYKEFEFEGHRSVHNPTGPKGIVRKKMMNSQGVMATTLGVTAFMSGQHVTTVDAPDSVKVIDKTRRFWGFVDPKSVTGAGIRDPKMLMIDGLKADVERPEYYRLILEPVSVEDMIGR